MENSQQTVNDSKTRRRGKKKDIPKVVVKTIRKPHGDDKKKNSNKVQTEVTHICKLKPEHDSGPRIKLRVPRAKESLSFEASEASSA